MKLLLAFSLLFASYCSIAGEKKTIIEQIQEAETIPVYIIHGLVRVTDYNPQFGKIILIGNETKVKRVDVPMPNEIDSLKEGLMENLKTEFDTDKFVYIMSGTEEMIKNDMKAKGYNFVVIIKFDASYSFEYMKPKVRRDYGTFVAHRKLSGVLNVGFFRLKEARGLVILKSINDAGGLIYDNQKFEVRGYVRDANKLMKFRHPMVLKSKFEHFMGTSINKLAIRLEKKHEKAMSKRNK